MELLEPISVGGTVLPNRIAVTAMVTRLSGEDGFVNDDVVERYVRFAEGGAGLVVVEATSVHGGKSGPLLKLSSDEFVPGMARLAEACHAASDSKVFLQIIHFLKVARSGWRQKVGDLATEEVEALPGLFAASAVRAREAGLDGVELHMAHAYTLSSLLSRNNRRRDEYGRSLENRMRLPSMVLEAVRRAVGPDYPVGVRFDAEECIKKGYSLPDSTEFAVRFAELGAAYVSLSAGGKFEDAVPRPGKPLYPYTGYSGDRCMPGDSYPDAFNIYLAAGIKKALVARGLGTPVVGTGKISGPDLAEELLARGACDVVGMARALLADPYWPAKLRAGRRDEIVRCIYCNVCKGLDENFQTVVCYLWPKGATQAPRPDGARPALAWPDEAPLAWALEPGQVRLSWSKPTGPAPVDGYDVWRSEDAGPATRLTSCTRSAQLDDSVVGGRTYRYRVVAYDRSGRRGPPSNEVEVRVPERAAVPTG